MHPYPSASGASPHHGAKIGKFLRFFAMQAAAWPIASLASVEQSPVVSTIFGYTTKRPWKHLEEW
jgi:hypothetical protein